MVGAEHTEPVDDEANSIQIDPDTPAPRPLHLRLSAVGLVFVGGLGGTGLRYLIEEWFPTRGVSWPWATFGINIAGAIRMAKDLGPGHTIVTILCDYGTRYQSKLFNPAFLRDKGLPVPAWLEGPARSLPDVLAH